MWLEGTVEKLAALKQLPGVPQAQVKLMEQMLSIPKTMGAGMSKQTGGGPIADNHRFWDTQPVLKAGDKVEIDQNGPIEGPKDQVRQLPYDLIDAFEWVEVELSDKTDANGLYELLREFYVEDDDGMFRFEYPIPFLNWALRPPGWIKPWHLGVRVKKSGKLIAFISAIPATVSIHGKIIKSVEINFLVVHRKLRSKRLAPVLIKEITRRVNQQGIWQAAYTAGVEIPTPYTRARYYHRSLNPQKLVDVRFTAKPAKLTMNGMKKLYALPDAPVTPGIRPMTKADVPAATALLNKYLDKYKIHVVFDEAEVAHWFLPRKNTISSHVVAAEDGTLTDMISYYHLPSAVLDPASRHKTVNAVYSYYNVSTVTPWPTLMRDMCILAKREGADVVNALDIMENTKFLKDLKFGVGDGSLYYYFFNWRTPDIRPDELAIVLL